MGFVWGFWRNKGPIGEPITTNGRFFFFFLNPVKWTAIPALEPVQKKKKKIDWLDIWHQFILNNNNNERWEGGGRAGGRESGGGGKANYLNGLKKSETSLLKSLYFQQQGDGSDAWRWIDGGTSFAYLNSCVRYQYDENASAGAPAVLMDAATSDKNSSSSNNNSNKKKKIKLSGIRNCV